MQTISSQIPTTTSNSMLNGLSFKTEMSAVPVNAVTLTSPKADTAPTLQILERRRRRHTRRAMR